MGLLLRRPGGAGRGRHRLRPGGPRRPALSDPPTRAPGLAAVFRRPGYRRLWAARTLSQCGDAVNVVALALLVLQLSGSAVGVTGVVVAEILPVLLVAPVAGALVDRWPRVRVMVAADLLRAACAAALAIWHGDLVGVYGLASGMALGAVFFNPAASSVLPGLVEERELVAANSGIWTAAVLAQIALAPLAGVLVVTGGYGPAFALNAVSFVASALLLRGLRVPGPAARLGRRRLLAEARAGISVIRRHPVLQALATGQLLAALSAGATSALLVVLAEEQLGATGSRYGLMLAAIGVGAALGPLVLLRLVRRATRPAYVFGPFALRGLVDLLLATVTALPPALAALVVYGVGTSTGAVTFTSLLQAEAPPEARGRVFAGMDVLWQGGRLVSLGVGGVLADRYGIQVVFALGGVLLLAAAAAGLRVRSAGTSR